MPNFTDFTDFLKDKQFIQWQLIPDNESDARWRQFISEHPHLEGELQKAIHYIKTTGLNKKTLTDSERQQLLDKIQTTIEANSKKLKIKRLVRYIAASCAAVALIVLGVNLYLNSNKTSTQFNSEEVIVGKLLNEKDIQLITEKETMSFEKDVHVQIEKDGKAKIIQENQADKTVETSHRQLNKLIVPYGKRSTLTLSDGSKVWLNSGSVLEFPAQFAGDNREVSLASGEMYIEVASDKKKPFYVHTSDFNVRVYGTRFNVSAYADSPKSVVLVEGSVSLSPSDNQEIYLSPNEQAIYSRDGTFNTQKVDVNHFISWKNGYLMFEDAPMPEVLKQIERYYNLSFNYDKDVTLKDLTCNGKIILSENLDNVMTTITLLTSVQYKKENNRIYITIESD